MLSATTVSREVQARVELEGELSGTPNKIGNEGMQTTCRGYLEA